MAEHVVLFAGPMGAGKTTAIQSLSEVEVVRTEAGNSERHIVDKATTTVALDYGEISINQDEKVRLYGIPGQRRFNFMWAILKRRAKGMVLLVNADAPDPVAEMIDYLEEFRDLYDRGGAVVGISRTDIASGPDLSQYAEALERTMPGALIPIFTIDPRNGEHMEDVLLALIVNIEVRSAIGSMATSL